MRREFAAAGLGMLLSGLTFGQAAGTPPAFEVAAVKVNKSGPSEPTAQVTNGGIDLRNWPMHVLIARAYQVPFDRIVGPEWLETERYDIVAKFGPDTTGDTLWLMLQNLLAERFKLAVHHERQPTPVYALLVGKNGPKLQEASAGATVKNKCGREGMQVTCQMRNTTMAQLADQLPHWVSRNFFDLPVVDQTGLSGAYDITLTWTMTDRRDQEIDPAGVSLFDAIQDQLGLKLEQRKAPVDRIVVDRAERIPTGN